MSKRRQRWVAWVLAAWLPAAGVASAVEATMMMLPSTTPAATVASSAGQEHASPMGCHGEHQMPMAAPAAGATLDHAQGDDNSPKACCNAGLCFCSCSISLNALAPSVTPAWAPKQTVVNLWAVGSMPTTPPAHPFRPPIV